MREDVLMMDYDEDENGKRMIYCTYNDTETASLYTNVSCPHCGNEQLELDVDACGETYTIECEECEKEYEMYFDASWKGGENCESCFLWDM